MGERRFFAIFHIGCFPRAEYSCGLGFPELFKEVTDTRDGFFCDTVDIFSSGADVGEWWPWCKEFEQIWGKEVSARHPGCRW